MIRFGRQSDRRRCSAGAVPRHRTGRGSSAMSHRDLDRHAKRSGRVQRAGRRRNLDPHRRRQQRLRRGEIAVRRRPGHQHAAFAARRYPGTTACSVLHACAWRPYRGLRRYHSASLDVELARPEARRRLQRRRALALRLHGELPEIYRAYRRRFPAIRRNRAAAGRGRRRRATCRRAGGTDQYDHVRAQERAAGRLVARRRQGECDPVDAHSRPRVLSRGLARGKRGDRRRRDQRCAHAPPQPFNLRPGRTAGEERGCHRPFDDASGHGTRPGQRNADWRCSIARATPPTSAPWHDARMRSIWF